MTVQVTAPDPAFARPADEARLARAAAGLRANGFTVHVVDTAAAARQLVLGLLPRDASVFTAIAAAIDEPGEFRSVRREAGDPGDDVYARIRLGATPEVVVGSVHAVTEDGRLVVASASGSQLAPYASGARRAIWVVGAQKVVPDLETALRRLRAYALPREHERLATYGQGSFIGRILILEREAFPDRGTVVLVREAIGF